LHNNPRWTCLSISNSDIFLGNSLFLSLTVYILVHCVDHQHGSPGDVEVPLRSISEGGGPSGRILADDAVRAILRSSFALRVHSDSSANG
jgi:hypothetical protein